MQVRVSRRVLCRISFRVKYDQVNTSFRTPKVERVSLYPHFSVLRTSDGPRNPEFLTCMEALRHSPAFEGSFPTSDMVGPS
jgi:hypothetical protein